MHSRMRFVAVFLFGSGFCALIYQTTWLREFRLILGASTVLMGGTLPAAARAVVRQEDVARRTLGVLYGVNTLGAVTGALLGTFYLFEHFGNRFTLWGATALNIIVALAAFLLAKSLPKLESREKADESEDGATA